MPFPQRLQVRGCERHILGRAGGSAGAHVPHGLLRRERLLTFDYLGIDEWAQLLEVAYRNPCCEGLRVGNTLEAVSSAECRLAVCSYNARQHFALHAHRIAHRSCEAPTCGAARHPQAQTYQKVGHPCPECAPRTSVATLEWRHNLREEALRIHVV